MIGKSKTIKHKVKGFCNTNTYLKIVKCVVSDDPSISIYIFGYRV